MFKFKWIFKYESIKINAIINNVYKFPNENLLLIGEKIYIYNSNLELIYSKSDENELFYMSGCIINDDSFILLDLKGNMTFYYKTDTENDLNIENDNLMNKYHYNTRIIKRVKNTAQILFYKENNDLICFNDYEILIYDFDKKKIIISFLRQRLRNSLFHSCF